MSNEQTQEYEELLRRARSALCDVPSFKIWYAGKECKSYDLIEDIENCLRKHGARIKPEWTPDWNPKE